MGDQLLLYVYKKQKSLFLTLEWLLESELSQIYFEVNTDDKKNVLRTSEVYIFESQSILGSIKHSVIFPVHY